MTPTTPPCRTCGSPHTLNLGRLPDVAAFAGAPLDATLSGGHLYACRDCGLVFRAPVLSDEQYLALYARGSVAVWEQQADREDFRLVRSEIPDAPADVLDIGCYTGQLLASLPPACRPHGVEPNPQAAAIAATRGVDIVARHWQELEASDGSYDIIIACDVIEHVADPLAFLKTLGARLRPGGRLLIATGNAQAWPWRLARSRFWYCYFPEHISFISPRWLVHMAPAAGLRVVRLTAYAHSPLPGPLLRAKALLATGAGLVGAALRALGRPGNTRAGRDAPARLYGGHITKDHLFSVLHKG